MPESSKILRTSLFFFVIGFAIFSWQVQHPGTLNFDEFHYIPAAKGFLRLAGLRNLEHPPLAKMLMAMGVGIFGDNPFGWRIMSVLFGALTLSGMYLWAVQLFKRQDLAIWTGFLTLVNFFLFVQSRIAMLDTFMFAFLVFAGWAFTAAWDARLPPKKARHYLKLTGLFLGLALACKWFSVIQWAGLVGLLIFHDLLTHFGIKLLPPHWVGLKKGESILWLVGIPIFVYFSTFLPFLFATNPEFTFSQIFTMQHGMWDLQKRVVSPHPYMSQWYTWAIMKRPIWYAFDKSGPPDTVRGVFLVGNPLIMLTGLLAVLYCLWDWIKKRRKESFFILYFYFLFYGSWVLIPRTVSFYYYYYPAAMILSFALTLFFENRAVWIRWIYLTICGGFFVYFYPILAAVQIPMGLFVKWMWLKSWI